MKNKFILLCFLLFAIFGCEKEIELNIDENESKLVLNSWLKTGKHPIVEINRSTFIFDKRGTDKIENAEVILFENDEEVGFLEHFSSGFYQNENIEIKPDAEYKIIAKVDGFEDVAASENSSTSLRAQDYEFDFKYNESNDQFGNSSRSEINITLKDNASTTDFYLFRLKSTNNQWDESQDGDTTYSEYYEYLESSDLQIEEVYLNEVGNMKLLKDELFNGNDYTVRFNTQDIRKEVYQDGNFNSVIQYVFEIHKVSKSLYLYLKSLENNQYPDPFTEPTQIYSNVENGYGILATSTIIEIVIEETRNENTNE